MITSGQQTITTTRAQIDGTSAAPCVLIMHNSGSNAVVLGNSLVTKDNGFELHANTTIQMTIPAGEPLFAVAATGTHDISWLRLVQ